MKSDTSCKPFGNSTSPLQRIFAELDGISKYQKRDKFKDRGPANDYRRDLVVNDFKEKLAKEEALKKDNVSMKEVFCTNIVRCFTASRILIDKMRVISPKVKKLAEVFMIAGEEMEWKKIEMSDEGGRDGNED
ncbi:434_t:CDS:2 [Rhizophagus irregularis]|nr:434_t:CDS:2 [Rhizophagus irregularis]